ncbi:hypothetical protein [Streptomyces phaeochromogenes]|uniref:hypothetical protein n=1 Tax=Streptomyces phaeochromogenes TaxID=1923 RepID=UPI00386821B4|nr:hypothetical protein OG277_08575 [Streptomyces phaeochromogenes]
MTEGQLSALGGFYLLVMIVLFIGACVLVNRFFGDRIRYNQRRRQVERQLNDYEVNSSIVDDILRDRRK